LAAPAASAMLCIGKASSGTNRVNRGGSWNNSSNNLASAYRNNNNPNNENNNIGFRVCAP
jgi:formylglycine-generating enzyme required for sulfatase activity